MLETRQRAAPKDHQVLVYRGTPSLVKGAAEFLLAGLRQGGSAVIVATLEHRSAIEAGLAAAGVDVDEARRRDALVSLDAEETMRAFLVDGIPETSAFFSLIGGLVGRASRGGGRVHVYGEMVALLWAWGEIPAAIELEELWNELGRTLAFSLLCGYPVEAIAGAPLARAFYEVRDRHCELVELIEPAPSGGTPGSPVAEQFFEASLRSLASARRFVADALRAASSPRLVDDAALVASELAASAVVRASSGFVLTVEPGENGVRIAVCDSLPQTAGRQEGTRAERRGTDLVAALAGDWGCEHGIGGRRLWAEIGAEGPPALGSAGDRWPCW